MINIQETPYDLAYKGNFEALKMKVEESPDLIAKKDNNERLLIHWAALGGHNAIVTYLLDMKSPTDPTDDIGMTPLILASSANKIQVVHLLIAHGAEVNAQNHEGHSALQYAASKGWKQIVDMLISNGANINIADKRGATPLHRAASKGDANVVGALLAEGAALNLDKQDVYGNSALHLACEENNVAVAKLLIHHGSSTAITNKEGLTPLQLASREMQRLLTSLNEL